MVIDKSGNMLNRPVIPAKPPARTSGVTAGAAGRHAAAGPEADFESILRLKRLEKEPVRFSKHAESRLASRNIRLTAEQHAKIGEALARAESKGIRDSLVLMDGLAFVVNVRSRTVVTVANGGELKDNIFTNIDGTVII